MENEIKSTILTKENQNNIPNESPIKKDNDENNVQNESNNNKLEKTKEFLKQLLKESLDKRLTISEKKSRNHIMAINTTLELTNSIKNLAIRMNKQIQEFNIIQILMNILMQEKNKNLSIQFSNKKFNKTKKNKINNYILGNISNNKKNPPKPENEIIIKLILSGKEKRTFIRLSPIPNKYSPFDIIKLIDKYLKTKKGERIYNSLYVPLAKVIGKNKGYCFVNLISPKYVVEFYKIFNGLNFNIKNCRKPCSVVFSDKQNIDCSNDDALKRPIIFNDVVKH